VFRVQRQGILRVGSPLALALVLTHDLRANAFAFVATENRYTLFRIMR
jgi:hypothetical protein